MLILQRKKSRLDAGILGLEYRDSMEATSVMALFVKLVELFELVVEIFANPQKRIPYSRYCRYDFDVAVMAVDFTDAWRGNFVAVLGFSVEATSSYFK